MKNLIIATRQSALALWQSEFIKSELLKAYPNLNISLEGFKTKGDVLLDSPLAKIGGKGLFTKELEEAMFSKKAHFAVHSLKDVPSVLPQGLKLAAISKRECENDALLSQKYKSFKDLPKGAKIGTTSLRRAMQLKIMRSDLQIFSLRGNVNSRIAKLKNDEFDGIILAYAGLKRLGLEKEVNHIYIFSKDEMIPAASQGALGIESTDEGEILSLLTSLNDENTALLTQIERDFIATLQGNCGVPIGVNAELKNADEIGIRGILGLPDGSEFLKEKIIISKGEAKEAGKRFAEIFIKQGALELLQRATQIL